MELVEPSWLDHYGNEANEKGGDKGRKFIELLPSYRELSSHQLGTVANV